MYVADQRIVLNAHPSEQNAAVFEVVMLGHCGGKADLSKLSERAIEDIRSVGLIEKAQQLQALKQAALDLSIASHDVSTQFLYDVPLPILSLADFQSLFPQSMQWNAVYESQLAGKEYWLPKAVADFFADEEQVPTGAKKLWIVRVNERDMQEGFLPKNQCDLTDLTSLRGMYLGLLPPGAAVIVMPDLERIQIQQHLPDIPRIHLVNPKPEFLPCSQKQADDGHRERRYTEEIVKTLEPLETKNIIARIIDPIHKYRPDIQCIWSLGIEYDADKARPALSESVLSDLKILREDPRYSHALHRVQFIFPYLRRNKKIYSATGAISGLVATQSIRSGTWRSIAGIALPENSTPYPAMNFRQAAQLRESHGIGLILQKAGETCLDDERLASPYTPKYGQALSNKNSQKSGELVRFMGFLQRKLRRLGERILFSMDPSDPRPILLLEQFFDRLHDQGALRGGLSSEAYSIERISTNENILKYEIQIAPAFSIDLIRLSFSHQSGENLLELDWERV